MGADSQPNSNYEEYIWLVMDKVTGHATALSE
jgi:hypothetical protein